MGGVRVVDTNVLIVANGESHQADTDCRESCVSELVDIQSKGHLALDEGRQILAEYSKYCSGSGAPRLGDEFFRWVFQTQYSS